jgi:hypothetical protein
MRAVTMSYWTDALPKMPNRDGREYLPEVFARFYPPL